jgi:hypothetical protein
VNRAKSIIRLEHVIETLDDAREARGEGKQWLN